MRYRTGDLRGVEVIDGDGRIAGRVADTWPLDGGGEPELALLQVGIRFPRSRYVPLRGSELRDGRLHIPWTKVALDDAPSADDRRWGDPAHVALAHWVLADE